MKKTLVFVTVMALALPIYSVRAAGGSLPDKSDPFWNVMSQLNRPDDSTCTIKTKNLLDSLNLGYDTTQRAEQTCQSIAQIVTSMQGAFSTEGVSTNLFAETNWHDVEGLYFDDTDGRIEFTKSIDFMSYDFMSFLSALTEELDIAKESIELNADLVGGLRDTGAILTMRNVSDYTDPVILVDGEEDTEDVVSGMIYAAATDTITFNASHFTKFTASERSDAGSKKPKIKSVAVLKYSNPFGEERVKVTIRGSRFTKKTDVTFGGSEAYKVHYKNSKKIVAYFKYDKLAKKGKETLKLRVDNPGSKEKVYHKRLPITTTK